MSTPSGRPDPFGTDRSTGHRHANTDLPETAGALCAHLPDTTEVEPTARVTDSRYRGPAHMADPRTTAIAAAAGATVATTIPLSFPSGGGPTAFDLAVNEQVNPRLDPRPWVAEVLTLATGAGVVLAVLCGAAVWFAWQRKWWETATMLLVPEAAVAINTWALKPFWSRPLHDYLAYPSGHTVHLVAVVTTLVLLLSSIRARTVIVVLAVIAWCGAGIGMIALDYHLATDIVGGGAAGITSTIALYHVAVYIGRHLGPGPVHRPEPR